MNDYTTKLGLIDKDCGPLPSVSEGMSPQTLSNSHICPPRYQKQVIFYKNGSRFEIKAPKFDIKGRPSFGGRGKITKFSMKSRRRLLYKVAEIDKSELPIFLTLTYPDKFSSDPQEWKQNLNNFCKRLKRVFPKLGLIWKLEPQKRGAPHFHILVWGANYAGLYDQVPRIWYEIAGSGDRKHYLWHCGLLGNGNKHCVSEVRSWRGVMAYAAKYLGKECTAEGWDYPGRFWGVKSWECIPWAEIVRKSITYKQGYELIRLMRRYANLKSRAYNSLSIFCNPDYWLDNFSKLFDSG